MPVILLFVLLLDLVGSQNQTKPADVLSRSIHLKIRTADTRWERGSSHHIWPHTFNSRSFQFRASHTKHQNPRTNSNSLLCFSDMCCSLFQYKILLICELSKEGAAAESGGRRAKIRKQTGLTFLELLLRRCFLERCSELSTSLLLELSSLHHCGKLL
jgi:hypothetical protein